MYTRDLLLTNGLLDFSGLLEIITRKDENQFNNVMYVFGWKPLHTNSAALIDEAS